MLKISSRSWPISLSAVLRDSRPLASGLSMPSDSVQPFGRSKQLVSNLKCSNCSLNQEASPIWLQLLYLYDCSKRDFGLIIGLTFDRLHYAWLQRSLAFLRVLHPSSYFVSPLRFGICSFDILKTTSILVHCNQISPF